MSLPDSPPIQPKNGTTRFNHDNSTQQRHNPSTPAALPCSLSSSGRATLRSCHNATSTPLSPLSFTFLRVRPVRALLLLSCPHSHRARAVHQLIPTTTTNRGVLAHRSSLASLFLPPRHPSRSFDPPCGATLPKFNRPFKSLEMPSPRLLAVTTKTTTRKTKRSTTTRRTTTTRARTNKELPDTRSGTGIPLPTNSCFHARPTKEDPLLMPGQPL